MLLPGWGSLLEEWPMTMFSEYNKAAAGRFPQRRRAVSFARAKPKLVLSDEGPSALVWFMIVFVLIVQQSAFIEMPALGNSSALSGPSDVNAINTVAIGISFAVVGALLFFSYQKVGLLVSKNGLSFAYVMWVLCSVAWSIHPDLTIRRALGYVLSMSIAAYLTVQFSESERMKLISASFAVSAIGSFLYVVAYPDEGIMRVGELAGAWRGVYPHKNVLGPVMAVGVFSELFCPCRHGGVLVGALSYWGFIWL